MSKHDEVKTHAAFGKSDREKRLGPIEIGSGGIAAELRRGQRCEHHIKIFNILNIIIAQIKLK